MLPLLCLITAQILVYSGLYLACLTPTVLCFVYRRINAFRVRYRDLIVVFHAISKGATAQWIVTKIIAGAISKVFAAVAVIGLMRNFARRFGSGIFKANCDRTPQAGRILSCPNCQKPIFVFTSVVVESSECPDCAKKLYGFLSSVGGPLDCPECSHKFIVPA